MSYLTDLGNTLMDKLSGLPETERAEIVAFVKSEVLTSYRNGLRDAEPKRPSPKADGQSSKDGQGGRPVRSKRRNYQQG